jgi:hypothetical protein
MKKKLTLLIFFLPFAAFAQVEMNNGTITFDWGKKKQQAQDTTQQKQPDVQQEENSTPARKNKKNKQQIEPTDSNDEQTTEETPKQKKTKTQSSSSSANSSNTSQQDDFNYKRDGLFKGLFHAGFNACQIDGDNEWGYKYLGANVGVGAMIRFHKYMSVSMEIDYSMKGAKARVIPSPNPISAQLYRIQWDYMEVPLAFNVHDKKLVMASVGFAPAVMVRYNERNLDGQDQTSNPPLGPPRKFDLNVFAGFGFIVKKNFFIGGKFSYSCLKIRGPMNLSRVNGQYNNVLSFKFMYILDSIKKKK